MTVTVPNKHLLSHRYNRFIPLLIWIYDYEFPLGPTCFANEWISLHSPHTLTHTRTLLTPARICLNLNTQTKSYVANANTGRPFSVRAWCNEYEAITILDMWYLYLCLMFTWMRFRVFFAAKINTPAPNFRINFPTLIITDIWFRTR